jgi:hypothetical protein
MRRQIQDYLSDDVVGQAQMHTPSFGQGRIRLQNRPTAHNRVILIPEWFSLSQPVELPDKPRRRKVSAKLDGGSLDQHPQTTGQAALSGLCQ